jgi:hypothetical protein
LIIKVNLLDLSLYAAQILYSSWQDALKAFEQEKKD